MMWYGAFEYPIKNLISKQNRCFKHKLKLNALGLRNRVNLNFFTHRLYLPSIWEFILIKNTLNSRSTVFYLYSPAYYFFLPIFKNFMLFYYEKQSSTLTFSFFFNNNFSRLFWNHFSSIFYSFSRIFFKKLKFKGKGYYIYKNYRNTIALQFGYSHLVHLYAFFVNVRFLTKTIILMFGINKKNVLSRSYGLFHLKPVNIFTGKGIRFSRQIIYRKTGKISSYR